MVANKPKADPPAATATVIVEPWCDIKKLHEHTGLSVSTLKRMTMRNEIPSTIVHGRVLFKLSRVDAALEALSEKIRAERDDDEDA